MHPPFFVVDHRVDYDPRPFEERRLVRRNRPQSLRFDPPSSVYPFETFAVVSRIIRDDRPSFRVRLASLIYRIVAGQSVPVIAAPERA